MKDIPSCIAYSTFFDHCVLGMRVHINMMDMTIALFAPRTFSRSAISTVATSLADIEGMWSAMWYINRYMWSDRSEAVILASLLSWKPQFASSVFRSASHRAVLAVGGVMSASDRLVMIPGSLNFPEARAEYLSQPYCGPCSTKCQRLELLVSMPTPILHCGCEASEGSSRFFHVKR